MIVLEAETGNRLSTLPTLFQVRVDGHALVVTLQTMSIRPADALAVRVHKRTVTFTNGVSVAGDVPLAARCEDTLVRIVELGGDGLASGPADRSRRRGRGQGWGR